MADKRDSKVDDSAENAYATAAEAVSAKSDLTAPEEEALVAFPPKARRNGKASAKVAAPAPQADVVKEMPAVKPSRPIAKKPVAKKPAVKKAAPAKTPAKTGVGANPAPKVAADTKTSSLPGIPTIAQLKDKIMATTKTPDFAEGIKDVISDVQTKAKEAFEKSTSAFGDVNEFAKGNVEAFVESGKILASGLQDMGTNLAAEGRSAFETMTADVKALTAVKSPADFFKLQGEIVRRNFDAAVANGSKNSEAMLKLASDVFAPLSGRVSVAVEKVRKAA